MLTNLPLLSVRNFTQKRQVQLYSVVPMNGTNLMWVTWNNSLPRNAVSLYNGYTNRVDYICKYKCDAGFYTPSKGRYCYYPSAIEKRSFQFEILVNKDNFEILEWNVLFGTKKKLIFHSQHSSGILTVMERSTQRQSLGHMIIFRLEKSRLWSIDVNFQKNSRLV